MARWPAKKKTTLWITIALQLGPLCFFKYTNFLFGIFADFGHALGLATSTPRFDILLPIGVSFYTFHGVRYVVDVYRGKLERPLNLLVVALYITFFPQLVAGPIVRADVFIPPVTKGAAAGFARSDRRGQVHHHRPDLQVRLCRSPRTWGGRDLLKPETFDNLTLATAALGFYSQIYFDFAGYSTMAIGVSRLFGFRLPKNFDFPYRSTSINNFGSAGTSRSRRGYEITSTFR